MFDNLGKEIIVLCAIPFGLIILIDIIAYFVMKKRNKIFKFNYFVKISLIVGIGIVLPLIIGYTFWVISSFTNKGIVRDNLWYIGLLIVLLLILAILIFIVYHLSLNDIKKDKIEVVEELNDEIELQEEKEKTNQD